MISEQTKKYIGYFIVSLLVFIVNAILHVEGANKILSCPHGDFDDCKNQALLYLVGQGFIGILIYWIIIRGIIVNLWRKIFGKKTV